MIEKYVESFLSKVEIVHDDLRNRTWWLKMHSLKYQLI